MSRVWGRGAWRWLFCTSVVLLGTIVWVPGDYGKAQTATTVMKFYEAVPADQRGWFRFGAAVDLFFAATYAALAVTCSLRVVGRAAGVVARFGAALVVAGAVLDEVENVRLLQNLSHYRTLSDDAVQRIVALGSLKLALGLGGAAIVLLCLVAQWLWSTDTNGGRMKLDEVAGFVPTKAKGMSKERRRVSMAVLAALIVGAAAFVLQGGPELGSALLAGLVIHLCLWLLRTLWTAELGGWDQSRRDDYASWQRRTVVVVTMAAIGLVLYLWFGRENHGAAVYVMAIGGYAMLGVVLRRWRKQDGPDKRRGPRILVGAIAFGSVCLLIATVNVSMTPLAGVVVAVLVFPIGLALTAEDHHRVDRAGAALRLAWGTAALAAGVAGLMFAGIGEYQTILVAVGLSAVVALVASDTSHDVVLVLVAIGLVWSLEPEIGPPEPDPEPGRPTIVALGDSFMSGEGASTFFEGTNHNHGDGDRNECRRAPTAYPVLVQEILEGRGEDYELLFIACSGAKADQLTMRAQYGAEPTSAWSDRGGDPVPGGQAQLPQAIDAIDALDLEPEVVLVSIGGNDAAFGEIGQTCGLAGDCTVLGQQFLEGLENTRERIKATYAQIADTFPDARILVVPYPVPLSESGCDVSLLRSNEHRYLVGFTRALDRVLEEEAGAAEFDFLARGVDVFTRPRARICDVTPSTAAVNQLAASPVAGMFLQQVSPRGWFHNTFHPNERGHKLLASEIASWISPPEEPLNQPLPSDAAMTLGGIMGAGFDHCGSADRVPATCHNDRSAWIAAATARMLWAILLPVLLIVVGALLLSMEGMRRWPREEDHDESQTTPAT